MDFVSFADQWIGGVTPFRLVRLAGLILLPYFYRKWRDEEQTLREQLTSWNVNLAFFGILVDVLGELLITVWLSIDPEHVSTEVAIGVCLFAAVVMVLALARLYFVIQGIRATVETLRQWLSGVEHRLG